MLYNGGRIMNDLEELKKQHLDNYRNAVIEIVKNNTNALVDDDIDSLINVPPLDSMDQIKNKFLAVAKKEKAVLETEKMNQMVLDFRKALIKKMDGIKKLRTEELISNLNKIVLQNDIIKITKKDLNLINKKIRRNIKEILNELVSKYLINNIGIVYTKVDDETKKAKMIQEMTKFLNSRGQYQKQLLENIDFKLLVKDTTLINGVKEQTDRYLFTKSNSHLFKW